MSVSLNVITPQGLEPLQFPTKFRSPSLVGLERSAVGEGGLSYSDSALVFSGGVGVDIRMTPQTAVRVAGDGRFAYGYEGGGTDDFTLTVGLVVGFGSR